jgi:hypothetical protein
MATPSRLSHGRHAPSLGAKRPHSLALSFFGLLSLTSAASITFTIASGQCVQGENVFNFCDNSATGGMCASAPNVDKEWCCEPGAAICGSWGETCTGNNNLAGRGQIFCQSTDSDAQWCCNSEYDVCVEEPGVFNLCRTKFSNPYKDTSEDEALSLKSAYFSTATSTSEEPTLTSSETSSTTATEQPSTTSDAKSSSTSNSVEEQNTGPAESDQEKEEGDQGGLSTGAKAGIAIGAVAAVALVGILAFFIIRRRRKGRQSSNQQLYSAPQVAEMQGASAAQTSAWQQQQFKYTGVSQDPPPVHELGPSTRPTELPAQTDNLMDNRYRQ